MTEHVKPPRIVAEDDVHSAMEYLRDSANILRDAVKRVRKAEHNLSHIEALRSKMSDASSDAKRKNDARTTQEWLDAAHEDAEAAGELAKLYALRQAATMVIEGWRTESATYRRMTL
jgi:hypothetical protein